MPVTGGYIQPLVEHWDGTSWTLVSTPALPSGGGEFYSVAATSSTDVWAVGQAVDNTPLAEHWNGTAWSVATMPLPGQGDNWLYGVTAVAANDVWAVGTYRLLGSSQMATLIEHWNGAEWSIWASNAYGTDNSLAAVTAISATDIWAVGSDIEYWDGTSWYEVPFPSANMGLQLFNGVTAVTSTNVWAVGVVYSADGTTGETLVEHWDGASWHIVPGANAANAPYSLLNAAVALSANNIWAVGYSSSQNPYNSHAGQTLTIHWNGTAWQVVPSPGSGAGLDALNAVAAVSSYSIWTVGYTNTPGGSEQTLTEQHLDRVPMIMCPYP